MADEKKVVKLSRADAKSVLNFVGFKSVDKWENDRMATKLLTVKDVLPAETPTDEKVAKTLIDVLAAIESGDTFAVEGGDNGEAVATKKEKVKKEKAETAETVEKTEEQKAQEAKEAEEKAAAKAKAKEEKAKAKAEKEAAKAKAKAEKEANKIPGIRPCFGNGYAAGLVVKELGLSAGVTPEVLEAFSQKVGIHNPKEAKFWVSYAWHVINAFTGEVPVEAKEVTEVKVKTRKSKAEKAESKNEAAPESTEVASEVVATAESAPVSQENAPEVAAVS